MNEEQKERRRAYKAKKGREYYARWIAAERERKNQAALARYKSLSPEQMLHRRALERQTWAKRKRKADLAKMSPEQRVREVYRWAKLAPEQQEAENTLAFDQHIRNSNAIDDLGTDTPDHSLSEEWSYARDKKVRDAVLRRAKGKCEFCGKLGFRTRSGKRYLETHHVIFLANDGADKLTNVIALCPNDHREAHFGKRCEEIETEMVLKLKATCRILRESGVLR
jgi:5-methylcytosine-specific restriction endonuclease McrA